MRLVQYGRYGKPSVLHEATAARPAVTAEHVLVRVHGSSVNHLDATIRSGLVRVVSGFSFPKGSGLDFAGEIVSVGEGAEGYSEGDRVWGFLPGLPGGPIGAASEYLNAPIGSFSIAPSTGELLDASALPLVASTALVALRERGHLTQGDRLLVRGGAGGVGSAAIQLGKAMGARVTAMAGIHDLDFVRELGADDALDYRTHGASQVGDFEVILDLVGTGLRGYRRHLAPHGRIVSTAVRAAPFIAASVVYGPRRVRTLVISPSPEVLTDIAGYVERGELRPVIDRVYPLRDAAEAHTAVEKGVGRGKHVIDVRA